MMGAFVIMKVLMALCVLSWYSAGLLKMINEYFYSQFVKQLREEFPKNEHLERDFDLRLVSLPSPPQHPHHQQRIQRQFQQGKKRKNSYFSHSSQRIHHSFRESGGAPPSAEPYLSRGRKIVKGRGGEYLFKPSQVVSYEIDESVRQGTSSPSYLSQLKADAAGTMTTTGKKSGRDSAPPSPPPAPTCNSRGQQQHHQQQQQPSTTSSFHNLAGQTLDTSSSGSHYPSGQGEGERKEEEPISGWPEIDSIGFKGTDGIAIGESKDLQQQRVLSSSEWNTELQPGRQDNIFESELWDPAYEATDPEETLTASKKPIPPPYYFDDDEDHCPFEMNQGLEQESSYTHSAKEETCSQDVD